MKQHPSYGPDPNAVYPNEAVKQVCFLKNVITRPNIQVGEYTYYDDIDGPEQFQDHVTHHYPFLGDKLIIGKFCAIARGIEFVMNGANHRMNSVTTYPFHVFGGVWAENTPPHLDQLPRKGDIVVGNDVWIGRESVILPGVTIGDGAIVAAYSVVTRDVPPYTLAGGNPARPLKPRFDPELTQLLLAFRWWDLPSEELAATLPLLCEEDLEKVRQVLRARVGQT